jgi:carbonic anhydrase
LRRKHRAELDALSNDDARATRIAELNIHRSINVLERHPVIQKAVKERGLAIHGLIYDLATGQLKVLE